MNEDYKYYIEYIKPIEKKYAKMCILYSKFKLKHFKRKSDFYNKILIWYYRTLITTNKLDKLFDND